MTTDLESAAIIESTTALLMQLGERITQLTARGMPMDALLTSMAGRIRSTVPLDALAELYRVYVGAVRQVSQEGSVERTMRKALAALEVIPGQAPALEASVILTGIPMMIQGSLSETNDGGLKMMSPNQSAATHPGLPKSFIEQYFNYDDVVVFAVMREVKFEAAPVIYRG